ncbi:MAG TPA: hypothetical protein VIY48_18735 [Candidatus Paceibacterota bacterium]
MGYPGVDPLGFRDPSTLCHPVYASTAARDTAVTALGGVTALQGKGFCCFVDTGAAWSFHYLTIAGLWKTATLA